MTFSCRNLKGDYITHFPKNSTILAVSGGDSNSIGWESATIGVTLPYGGGNIARANVWNSWGDGAGIETLTQRNAADGTATYALQPDLGTIGAVPDAAIGPEYSLGAERVLSLLPRYADGAGAGLQWSMVKHGVSGATWHGRSSGALNNYHPDDSATITTNLLENLTDLRTYVGGLAGDWRGFWDAAYMTLGSADAATTAGLEPAPWAVIGNIKRFQMELGRSLGITHPAMVITLPLGGSVATFTDERVSILRKQYEKARKMLMNVAFVEIDDLERQPDGIHFTAEGHIELGRRFAAARDSLGTPIVEVTL